MSAIEFQRDSIGDKLFISYFFRKGNEAVYRTLIVTADGISERSASPRAWYDDNARPVFELKGAREWYEGEGASCRFFSRLDDATYVFLSGCAIAFRSVSDIEGVSGGSFVLVHFRETPGWIVSAPSDPKRPVIELPQDLDHPQRAFGIADGLVIFGTFRSPKDGVMVKCLIYRTTATSARLVEQIPIPWAGNVYDMWPETGDVLIRGKSTKFAGYYCFNIITKRRFRLPGAPDRSLFLRRGVINTARSALKRCQSTIIPCRILGGTRALEPKNRASLL